MTVQVIETDVCIIGSGTSGSIVAAKLAGCGLRIDLVEQGRQIAAEETYDDILGAAEPALARLDNGAWGAIGYPWTTCNVGGGTVFYGGASYRLRAVDFAPDAHLPGAELSGRWPIVYQTLAHAYDEIELALGLSGEPAGCDPTHPGGPDPPLPPITPSPQARRLGEAARRLGLSPFATPMLIASTPYRGRPACDYCSPCIEHRCSSGAKADAHAIFVAPLVRNGEVTLHEGIKAIRFVAATSDCAEVLEAIHLASGTRMHWRARVFVLAANAIQSAAVLLRSQDLLAHTAKIALVGRGLCMKINGYVVGHPDRALPTLEPGDRWKRGVGPFSTITSTDYYLADDCPTGLGGLIYEARHGWRYGTTPETDVARLECLVSDTPSLENRVRLSKTTDKFGIPLIAIDYRPHPRDLARLRWLTDRAADWLKTAGFSTIWQEPGGYMLGSSHLHGTCRAGHNPADSVVNHEGRLHACPNVFVADGAYMPFPGAVSPTLTIQAIAAMVSNHVGRSLGIDPIALKYEGNLG
jgi:choline dehydrogenase-like flavoprotein